MTQVDSARLYGLGYRRYEGLRRAPIWAVAALALFTGRRVLGSAGRRGTRRCPRSR